LCFFIAQLESLRDAASANLFEPSPTVYGATHAPEPFLKRPPCLPPRRFGQLAADGFGCPADGRRHPHSLPGFQGFSAERLARIRPVIQAEIDAKNMPGAVVVVARKGAIVYSDAIGVKQDAIFRAYSMTKPMTSVLAMMMVEEGQLQLADPVSKFLPALAQMQVLANPADPASTTVAAARPILVHDLLRHTSGLTYAEFTRSAAMRNAYISAGLFSNEVPSLWITLSPEQQVAAFAKAPLQWQPGSTWEYSLSTDLLGRVLEVVGKKPLGVLLHERLIKPLGMKDTAFVVPANQVHRIAQPLAIDPLTQKPMAPMLDLTQVQGNDAGGAGLVTTAADYLRFCQMLLNNGTLDGRRYISRTTLALMTSDHLGPKVATPLQPGELLMGVQGYTFGLGFMVRQGPGLASVPGSEGDYAWAGAGGTFFWIDPKEQVIGLLMAQTPGPIRQYYRRMIKQLVYQALE
jgi:CubicO group peptidase (beta-lactamase class C family)